MRRDRPLQRVRQSHVEWVAERLTDRDRAVVTTVGRLRLVSGQQLERLFLSDLTERSRAVVRWRLLKRLTDWRVLLPLERRIGGRPGSGQQVYALDSTGQRLLELWDYAAGGARLRRPTQPGLAFVDHTLATSQLYVEVVEAARRGWFVLSDFRAEPAAWLPDGHGGWLKPDAYLRLSTEAVDDHWWIEVDRATTHLPALRRKLQLYLDYWRRGLRPDFGVMPRVLITVPTEQRAGAVQTVTDAINRTAPDLCHVARHDRAVDYFVRVLRL